MGINVCFVKKDAVYPVVVQFGSIRPQKLTKKAAIELRKKLDIAIDELLVDEALGDDA